MFDLTAKLSFNAYFNLYTIQILFAFKSFEIVYSICIILITSAENFDAVKLQYNDMVFNCISEKFASSE